MKKIPIPIFNQFKLEAKAIGLPVYLPTDSDYNSERQICNARFNYFPGAIATCMNATHVAFCINFSRVFKVPFRVRSGGHQHEGMCSANNVIMINLSLMNAINFTSASKTNAWIGVGTGLQNVYNTLESQGLILPGGGCGSVCIGGLTQGGGWGLSARNLGLTCDNILQAEVVLADGRIVMANAVTHDRLFWAIRGGGGGNFGVVTRFLFKISKIGSYLTTFEVDWAKKDMEAVTLKWVSLLTSFDRKMTTVARLSVVSNTNTGKSLQLFGQYFGTEAQARQALKPLYDIAAPSFQNYQTKPTGKKAVNTNEAATSSAEDSLQVQLGRKLQELTLGAAPPAETCGSKPNPHKVSSVFPLSAAAEQNMIRACIDFINRSVYYPTANTYLSIHSFGGAIKDVPSGGTAFAFRDKNFLLQFQAWWSDVSDPLGPKYIKWIEDFRIRMTNYAQGAFINFPDIKQPLLTYYGPVNFNTLQVAKRMYDPTNMFNFPMSIPLPAAKAAKKKKAVK
jgi:hypothetical protein